MAEKSSVIPDVKPEDIAKAIEEVEYVGRKQGPRLAVVIGVIAFLWSLFQLWIASPLPFIFGIGIIVDVPARGIHLAFGLVLCDLLHLHCFALVSEHGVAGDHWKCAPSR